MRNVKTLLVGDVITCETAPENTGAERNDYFLVTGAEADGSSGEACVELHHLGPERFRDVEITGRSKLVVVPVQDLGKIRRHARYNRHVTFTRA